MRAVNAARAVHATANMQTAGFLRINSFQGIGAIAKAIVRPIVR